MPPEFEEVAAEEVAQAVGTEEWGEDECDDACCGEEDPLGDLQAEGDVVEDAVEWSEGAPDSPQAAGALEQDGEHDSSQVGLESSPPPKKRQKAGLAATSRLEALSKPKPIAKEVEPAPVPTFKRPEKKAQKARPSTLMRLRPTNLEEAWQAFEASGFTEAPRFTYAYPEDLVTEHFESQPSVCFELLPEAKRILQKVQDEYGGPEAYMQLVYGERKISAEELRDIVAEYLRDHNVEDKVDIVIKDGMLAAANVTKPGGDQKYVVNIANGPISWNLVPGLVDHEVGTHLLRMMNDEHQVWHGSRERYKLANPWTTEEGFATLNTYQTMPRRLMYPQALSYYAVCRGAQTGFVELFNEMRTYATSPKRCWQMCCRIKRGMVDTSLPGAFYLDQAYFKGAVEILRHLEEVDFGRLYGGQIALQDLDKVHFLLRKEVVRLPRFLKDFDTLKAYKVHCRKLIKENGIEAAIETVCKPVFIRTAKEFFKKPKQQVQLNATIAIGESVADGKDGRSASCTASRTLDAERLLDLARPKQFLLGAESETESQPTKFFDRNRVLELSQPRRCVSEAPVENRVPNISRAFNFARLEDLAKPRTLQMEIESDGVDQKREGVERKSIDANRLLELALPRRGEQGAQVGSSNEAPQAATHNARAARRRSRPRRNRSKTGNLGAEEDPEADALDGLMNEADGDVPPPPEPLHSARSIDEARLAELATPRKKKCEEDCKCPPKAGSRRKRRSKLRILAMVQGKLQGEDEDEEQMDVTAGPEADNLSDGAQVAAASDPGKPDFEFREEQSSEARPHANEEPQADSRSHTPPQDGVPTLPTNWTVRDDVSESLMPPTLPADNYFVVHSSRPASEEPTAERMPLKANYKPRSRAVARARSSSVVRAAEVARSLQESNLAGGLAALANSLGQRYPSGEQTETATCARRPRVPVGLPRGAAAAVAAAARFNVGGASVAGGAGAPESLWKAVPIKIMQFDCGL